MAAWNDNFVCASPDIGLYWEHLGRPCNARSVRITEPSEPSKHDWSDNALCYDTRQITLYYGMDLKSWQPGQIRLNDPSDPAAWRDNYLIVDATPPGQCGLQALGVSACGLEQFRATTFPGGRDLSDGTPFYKKLLEGTVSVHAVNVRDDGRVSADVTLAGKSEQKLPGAGHPLCSYSYTGTVGVLSEYDAVSKTAALRPSSTGCAPFSFTWTSHTEHPDCKSSITEPSKSVENELCFRELRLRLNGQRLVLAEPPF